MKLFFRTCLLIALAAPCLTLAGGPGISIDCDGDGNLANALLRAERAGLDEVRFTGNCKGNFVINMKEFTLRGSTPETSILTAADDSRPVLTIGKGERISIRNSGIRGGTAGIFTRDVGGDLLVYGSEVRDASDVGIYFDAPGSLAIRESIIESNNGGVAVRRGEANFQDSVVRDNERIGISIWNGADGAMGNMEVTGNGQTGLEVNRLSSFNVAGSTFLDNGEIHLSVRDRSRLHLISDNQVGASDDETPFGAYCEEMAWLRFGPDVVHGDILGQGSCFASINSSSINGSLILNQFAKASIFNTDIEGTISCESGGDATCRSTSAVTDGCPTAADSCSVGDSSTPSENAGPQREVPTRPEIPSRLR